MGLFTSWVELSHGPIHFMGGAIAWAFSLVGGAIAWAHSLHGGTETPIDITKTNVNPTAVKWPTAAVHVPEL